MFLDRFLSQNMFFFFKKLFWNMFWKFFSPQTCFSTVSCLEHVFLIEICFKTCFLVHSFVVMTEKLVQKQISNLKHVLLQEIGLEYVFVLKHVFSTENCFGTCSRTLLCLKHVFRQKFVLKHVSRQIFVPKHAFFKIGNCFETCFWKNFHPKTCFSTVSCLRPILRN